MEGKKAEMGEMEVAMVVDTVMGEMEVATVVDAVMGEMEAAAAVEEMLGGLKEEDEGAEVVQEGEARTVAEEEAAVVWYKEVAGGHQDIHMFLTR